MYSKGRKGARARCVTNPIVVPSDGGTRKLPVHFWKGSDMLGKFLLFLFNYWNVIIYSKPKTDSNCLRRICNPVHSLLCFLAWIFIGLVTNYNWGYAPVPRRGTNQISLVIESPKGPNGASLRQRHGTRSSIHYCWLITQRALAPHGIHYFSAARRMDTSTQVRDDTLLG